MSLNDSLNLKIVRGEEIRKVYRLPHTLAELQEVLRAFYGSTDFQITYVDDEGDHITISNDQELLDAYDSAKGKLSIKLIAKERVRESCDPIVVGQSEKVPVDAAIEENKDKQNQENIQNKNEKKFEHPGQKFFMEMRNHPMAQHFFQNFQRNTQASCDGCEKAIDGLRYKCSVCPNFDYCETCESSLEHPHPFLKINLEQFNPEILSGLPIHEMIKQFRPNFQGPPFPRMFQQFTKNFKQQRPKEHKATIIEHLLKKNQDVSLGDVIQAGWTVKNTGIKLWPAGSKVVFSKGSLTPLEEIILPEIQPGQQYDVILQFITPMEVGRQKGVWEIDVGVKKFGKLPITVNNVAEETLDDKIATLMSMGFTDEEARRGLESANGDVNQAASKLLLKA